MSRPVRPALRMAAFSVLFLVVPACLSDLPEPQARSVVRGPLPTRSQHPLALTQLALPPRRAATVPGGRAQKRLSLAWTSIFERSAIPDQSVQMDGEIGRAAFHWRHGLGPDTDLEAGVAVLYASSGFLDEFVEEFHQLTGLPGGGRVHHPQGQYQMTLGRNGRRIFDVQEDQLSLGDTSFVLTQRVRRENLDGPAVALRVGMELPTGHDQRGFSNGKLDWGAGLLLERSFDRLTLTGGIDWLHAPRPDSFEGSGVELDDRVSLKSGWEYRWNAWTSCLLQLDWTSAMTSDYDLEEINRETFDLGLGVATDLGPGLRWIFSIHEDLVAATGPDFGLYTALVWGF